MRSPHRARYAQAPEPNVIIREFRQSEASRSPRTTRPPGNATSTNPLSLTLVQAKETATLTDRRRRPIRNRDAPRRNFCLRSRGSSPEQTTEEEGRLTWIWPVAASLTALTLVG